MCQTNSCKLPPGARICYKVVLEKKIGGKPEFRSPYQNCKFESGGTYTIKRGSEPGGQAVYDRLSWLRCGSICNFGIGEKAIHSFVSLDDAKAFRAELVEKGHRAKKCHILECEIPENAVYVFQGDFTYYKQGGRKTETGKSYASSALKVLGVVDCAVYG